MKQKNITSIVLIFFSLGGVSAQSTVLTTGNEASGTGGSVSYSIGQSAYTSNSGSSGTLSQGVQQPYEISTTVGIKVKDINLNLVAFPNPTKNSLTLNTSDYNSENLSYQLFDLAGKLLDSKQLMNSSTEISLQEFPISTYFINILDNNTLIKTFRIVKN